MEQDALDAGVYGGLTTKENIKLLICYIINNVNEPLPQNPFCDEMHADGIANYFELAAAFEDLKQKELIIEDKKRRNSFNLTPAGKETIAQLKENLPLQIRRWAYMSTMKMLRRLKYQEQTKVEATRLDSGEYLISCSVFEGKKEMMTVKLNVPSFEDAQNAKNIFWDSPETVYTGIIELLTHNEMNYKIKEFDFPDK